MENATKTNKYATTLPARLRSLLEETETTQQVLADYCGVERQTIAKWKDGVTRPDADALCKLAQFFNVSADYLIGISNNRTTDRATLEMCATLGLSDRSIAFLRGEIEPLMIQEQRKQNFENVDTLFAFCVSSIQSAVNYLIEDHIETCTSSIQDRSILEIVDEFKHRLSMPERSMMSLYGAVAVTTPEQRDVVIGESQDGFWQINIKEGLLTSSIQDITANLAEKKNHALKKEGHNET